MEDKNDGYRLRELPVTAYRAPFHDAISLVLRGNVNICLSILQVLKLSSEGGLLGSGWIVRQWQAVPWNRGSQVPEFVELARKVEGQWGFAGLSQVGCGAGCPGALAQGGDGTISRALPVTSEGVFSDMLNRCKKDGPVPTAQPRDASDFSLYAPETKPCCSSTYKLQGPRALAFTTWPLLRFWSTLIAAAYSLSHDCQTAKCPRSLSGL